MPTPHPEWAIDLDKIVAAKFPGKIIPKWFINRMKSFIHQDFLNEFLVRGHEGVEFCTETMNYLNVGLEVEGLENVVVPEGARLTFVSNHPLGGVDGVAVGSVVGENFPGGVRLLVNDFLMALKGLAPICVPINKTGGQSRALSAMVREAYSSPDNMIVFPAGLCSRKIKGRITDLPWGKNFVQMSAASGRYVVPMHFIGRNSKRFYNVANISKWLGIKFNIAMLLLPDELYRHRNGRFKIIFGKPIPPETFDKSRTPAQWAAWVREQAYSL